MKITNKLNSLIKLQFFICLVLSINFGFANIKSGSTSNSKFSPIDINDFNEITKQDKKEYSIKNSSNNNFIHFLKLSTTDKQKSSHFEEPMDEILIILSVVRKGL